jgi:Zn-dependent protease
MHSNTISGILITYIELVVLLTFHEFGHAWTALKCGDDTAYRLGRVSLNPLDHIDPIGTVLIPLLGLFGAPYSRFLVGWAKPVPVTLHNLRHPVRDDLLVTMAGPGMNLLLAFLLIGVGRLGQALNIPDIEALCFDTAELSLMLFFFNLIPIPPLDGSRVMRVVVGMSYETYFQISRFGWFILVAILQIPAVPRAVGMATIYTFLFILRMFGMHE